MFINNIHLFIQGIMVDDKLGQDFGDLLKELARKIAVPEGHVIVPQQKISELSQLLENYKQQLEQYRQANEGLLAENRQLQSQYSQANNLLQQQSRMLEQRVTTTPTATAAAIYSPQKCALCEGLGKVYIPETNNECGALYIKDHIQTKDDIKILKNDVVKYYQESNYTDYYVEYIYRDACASCRGAGSLLVHNPPSKCGTCNGRGYTKLDNELKRKDGKLQCFSIGNSRYASRTSAGPWLTSCSICLGSGWAHVKK